MRAASLSALPTPQRPPHAGRGMAAVQTATARSTSAARVARVDTDGMGWCTAASERSTDRQVRGGRPSRRGGQRPASAASWPA
jgi:hypothetical protein